MAPRKKLPQDSTESAAEAPLPTRSRPSRSKATTITAASPSVDENDDFEQVVEDIKPRASSTRSTRTITPTASSTARPNRSTRAKESNASTASTSVLSELGLNAAPTSATREKKKKNSLETAVEATLPPVSSGRSSRRTSRESLEAAEGEVTEELEQVPEDEEEEVVPVKRARKGNREAVIVESEGEEAEEEDIKPVIKRGGRKRSLVVVPPSPVRVQEDVASSERAKIGIDNTPTKAKRAPKIIADDSSDEEIEPEAAVTLPQPLEAEVEGTPPPASPSAAAPATELPPPRIATTANDLASAARNAALNHAAMEKQREKEREGKPRLVIHQLVLEDFKSYRGRGIIGPFHKSFSSIVGPNGSGKSNTIDALLFVFGYRATKMRQGKLSELIHNSGAVADPAEDKENDMEGAEMDQESDEDEYDSGAKQKKGKGKGKGKGKSRSTAAPSEEGLIGSCTVEVWFREIIDLPGRDAFTVVPNSQLIVARTAFRNNSSRYSINGRKSDFTEVTTLLKGRGIDLDHKRFLILQGEVESIAQMKPKGATEHDEGLLEYLEDIIGTSKYKPEIEAAIVEVERLNDARGVQLNRVKLVEREKGALEGRKKEADSYLRDQNELAHNQSAWYQVNIHQAAQNAAVLEENVAEASAELTAEAESQKGAREEAEANEAEFKGMLQQTTEVEELTNELRKELAALDKIDVGNNEKIKSLNSKVKKAAKARDDDTNALARAQTEGSNSKDKIDKLRTEVEGMDATLEKEELQLEILRDSLKGKTERFSVKIEALQTDLQPWEAQIVEKRAEVDLASSKRDLLADKNQGVESGIKAAEDLLQKLASENSSKSVALKDLTDERKVVNKEVEQLEAKLKESGQLDQRLRAKATAARQKSDEAKASQTANRSQGNVLSSLTKLKEQGRLAGFHGRLGNLGRIDDKYDVAISTACPGLDNLVTDTVIVGQACIEHLKKNDLGRANVMCLDRVKGRDMSPIKTPEDAPRLFDLITVKDSRFAPAFFQLLTNTLVATDLEQGKRLAFGSGNKRFRVVTLDGQVIDVSGTMSGGGGRPMKGKMGSRIAAEEVSPEMIAKCEQEHQVAGEALKAFVVDKQAIEKELATLRKRLPEIETEILKVKMDIETGSKRRAEANERLEELRGQSVPDADDLRHIAQFEAEIAGHSKDLSGLDKKSSAIHQQIKVLEEQILDAGGLALRTQQSCVKDLKASIDSANDRLTKTEVGMAKCEKDVVKLTKAIESTKSALQSSESELVDLKEEDRKTKSASHQLKTKVKEAEEILDEKREELKGMKKILDQKQAGIIQFQKRTLELKQQLSAHEKSLQETQKAINHWNEKLGDLRLNEIEEEDEGEEPVESDSKLDTTLHLYTDDEIAELDVKLLKAKISALEELIAKSTLDLSVLKEYARREKEFEQRAADLELVTAERDNAKRLSDDLRNQRLKEFMEGFGIISMKLKEMYQMITLGGNAELELVDSLDPFSEGIIFSVMPPKKSWKNISNLSGGEKTLSSLALVFALHVFKPTPLYFMDEIDAALDFRNVSIVANYIKDRTKNAQFIIISLRNNMFELSSRLIGIYKVANQTRSVAIDNHELSEVI